MSLNSFWVGRTLCDTSESHGGRWDQSRMPLPSHTCPPARVSRTRRAAAQARNIRSRFVFCGRQRPWQDDGRGEENVCWAFGAPSATDSHASSPLSSPSAKHESTGGCRLPHHVVFEACASKGHVPNTTPDKTTTDVEQFLSPPCCWQVERTTTENSQCYM